MLSKSSFYKTNPPYEIIRAATKLNTQVRGGMSKLLKAIKQYVGDNPLVYYVELDHFNGVWLSNEKSGFELVKMQPTIKLWYVNDNVVKNRDSYHSKEIQKLREKGAVYFIYTTGTAKYVFNTQL